MQSITVSNISLFRLAQQQLDDATQWIRIAQLNNLNNPMIVGSTTILIPSPNSNALKGVPN